MESRTKPAVLSLIGPGLLVAATGVGAGDLATASFTGSQLGTAILWAVVVGAFLKFVMTEGLARRQRIRRAVQARARGSLLRGLGVDVPTDAPVKGVPCQFRSGDTSSSARPLVSG